MNKENTKKLVKDEYGKIAKGQKQGCGCCSHEFEVDEFARSIGYSDDDLKNIPKEANLGLSCGNPTAIADLKVGETVLDLGSGAGFDCFLAASRVGSKGRVIGIDMTEAMVEKAKANAKKTNINNVEFRLGEIENLPVKENSIDVVISNCVINLSTDKPRVFKEIYRVLKKNGRMAISDIALRKRLPDDVLKNVAAYLGCVSGALLIDELKDIVETTGFRNSKISIKGGSCCEKQEVQDPIGKHILDSMDMVSLPEHVVSVYVEGSK